MEMLKAENLTKAFDQHLVLKGVSFSAGPGDIYLIVGKNGSGKTTLLRGLACRIEMDSGTLHCKYPRAVFPSEEGFFSVLTVKENLLAFAALEGLSARLAAQSLQELQAYFECESIMTTQYGHCSRGQKQLCFIMRSFINPTAGLFLLDEPFAHLDSARSAAVAEMILQRAQKGSCFILTGQEPIQHPQIQVKTLNNGILI